MRVRATVGRPSLPRAQPMQEVPPSQALNSQKMQEAQHVLKGMLSHKQDALGHEVACLSALGP